MARSWTEIRRERREAERELYQAQHPQITRELVEQRVEQAEQRGETIVSFVVWVGRPPKPRANNQCKMVRLGLEKAPRSNQDSRLEPLGTYTFRAWWLVSDLRMWLRKTQHQTRSGEQKHAHG